MRRYVVWLLCAAVVLLVVGCGGGQKAQTTETAGSSATQTQSEPVAPYPELEKHLSDDPYVYVAIFAKKGVCEQIDAQTSKKVDDIKVGSDTSDLALKPDGSELYAVAPSHDRIEVIDVASGKVVRTLKVPDGPACVAFLPDGSRYLVAHAEKDYVSVYDAAADKKVSQVKVGKGPYTVRVNFDGTKAYVGHGMTVPDPKTIMKTRSFEIVEGAREVDAIDLVTMKVAARIPTLGNSVGISWRPDGNIAYAVSREIVIPDIGEMMKDPEKYANYKPKAEVVVIDAAADKVIEKLPYPAQDLAFNPDGTKCYLLLADSVVVVDGRTHEKLTKIPIEMGG